MANETKPIRVLIVEDNEADYVYARALLEQVAEASYEVDWAPTYDEGLERLQEGRHDAYLLDHRLGAQTGIELLQAAHGILPPPPIIFMTGMNDSALDRKAMKYGASDFLIKGELTADQLERSIRYALERSRLLSEMERIASHDPLTGLANLRQFRDFLNGAVARTARSGQLLGLLSFDLDHFKEINDQYGHDAGDQMLVKVAKLLNGCVRSGDLVARIGGDEFAVILDNIGSVENATCIAEKILEAFDSNPIAADSFVHQVKCSIGIAVFPGSANDVNALRKASDAAMYEAKLQGRNNYQLFQSQMQKRATRRAHLHRALERAIAREELEVHYQFQVAGDSSRLVGLEALLRWSWDGQQISPAEFIPIAEETGLICTLGEWVMNTAASQFMRWDEEGLLPNRCVLAVNVSTQQIGRGELTRLVHETTERTGLAPTRLEIEVTESLAMDDAEAAITELEKLRDGGYRIALDDFGTGHSSLSYLHKLPVQTLKIDRSFIRDAVDIPECSYLLASILSLAHNLNLIVVAEGVEREDQRLYLLDHGCSIMQGYYFHRPQNAMEIRQLLLLHKEHAQQTTRPPNALAFSRAS